MSRGARAALPLALLIASLVSSAGAAAPPPSRPYEAPLFHEPPAIPPIPPEYLTHEEDGIRFAYHPSARDRVRQLIEEAPKLRARLALDLGTEVLNPIEVRVAVGSGDFGRILPPAAPRGSGVVALSQRSLLALGLHTGATGDPDASFRRGMAFLALDQASHAEALPRWLRVGYALHVSGEQHLARTRALWWGSMRQELAPLVDLEWRLRDEADVESLAAAQSADFVGWLFDEPRADTFPQLLAEVRDGRSFEQGVRNVYQADLARLEAAWRRDLAKHKAFVPVFTASFGLWVLVALAMRLARRLRKRREIVQPEAATVVRVVPEPRMPKLAHHLPAHERRLGADALEADVPKISHDGRWHTLH
jgi:hypothetical protein